MGCLEILISIKETEKMSDKELELVMEYEEEVQKVVRKYTSYFDQDDLYQVGMIGLMKAVQHVDYDKLEQFRFYARYYIQGEINQFLRENNMIKQSKEQIALRRRYNSIKESLTQQIGRCPTLDEMALSLEISKEDVEKIEQSNIEVRSLDYQQEDEDNNLYSYIKHEEKAYRDDYQDLYQAIDTLPSPDKEIIIAQFFQDYTQQEIANELGLSQVQVYRKKEHGLQLIKQKVA